MIAEIPVPYEVRGVAPGGRKAVPLLAIATAAVEIAEADDLPLVARADPPLGRLGSPGPIEARTSHLWSSTEWRVAPDGQLLTAWRPVWRAPDAASFSVGAPVEADRLLGLLEDIASGRRRADHMAAMAAITQALHPFSTLAESASWGASQALPEAEIGRLETLRSDGRDGAIAAAAARAGRFFLFGGLLWAPATPPALLLNVADRPRADAADAALCFWPGNLGRCDREPNGETPMAVVPQERGWANNGHVFRLDGEAEAEALWRAAARAVGGSRAPWAHRAVPDVVVTGVAPRSLDLDAAAVAAMNPFSPALSVGGAAPFFVGSRGLLEEHAGPCGPEGLAATARRAAEAAAEGPPGRRADLRIWAARLDAEARRAAATEGRIAVSPRQPKA